MCDNETKAKIKNIIKDKFDVAHLLHSYANLIGHKENYFGNLLVTELVFFLFNTKSENQKIGSIKKKRFEDINIFLFHLLELKEKTDSESNSTKSNHNRKYFYLWRHYFEAF